MKAKQSNIDMDDSSGYHAKRRELDDSLSRDSNFAEQAYGKQNSPVIETNNGLSSLESSLEQAEVEVMRLQSLASTSASQQPQPSEAATNLDDTIEKLETIAVSQTITPETQSRALLILGSSLSIRNTFKRTLNVKTSIEDKVQAVKAFVECLIITNRHKSEQISARLDLLVEELNFLLDEPYDRELFEQILEPLRTLRITLSELEKYQPWLIVWSGIHIARYLDSDLEATDSFDEALDGLSLSQTNFPDDPIATTWYSSLVKRHAEKFLATENIEIVDRLIKLFSQLRVVPEIQSLEHEMSHKELGDVFEKVMQRFTNQSADYRDLHRALSIYNEYELYMAVKDPYMPILLLCKLSDGSGAWGDADRVFRLVELATKEHPPTVKCFTGSTCVCIKATFAVQRLRYNRTKNAAVLDASIATAENLLVEAKNNAKARSYVISQLADLRATRGKLKMKNKDVKGAEEDLHQAMTLAEAELEENTANTGTANTVANICESLFYLTKERQYVDKAIVILLAECDLSESRSEPGFPGNCYDAGYLLLKRNRAFREKKDRAQALELLKRGHEYTRGNLEMRIFCAQEAAQVEEDDSHWEEASSLYRLTIDLIRSFELQHMRNVDRQRKVSQFGLVATSAAATLLNAGGSATEALCLLESGRELLASSLRELRGDISSLKDVHPALAKDFITLRDAIDFSGDEGASIASTGSERVREPLGTDRQYAVQQFRKLIDEIRKLPDFTEFLATATVEELMSGAQHGPAVILNCSQSRCDALLVTVDDISNIRLSIKGAHVIRKVRELRASGVSFDLLKWLWDMIVSPVLEALGYDKAPLNGKFPRVWWIPTGYLSLLPIHAAGAHLDRSSNAAIDRVMSSYATSLTSLVDRSRRNRSNKEPNGSIGIKHATLVSMTTTPGLGQRADLLFAEKETEVVKGLMASLKIEVAEPFPDREHVLDELRRSQLLHFAGHGKSNDVELSASSFLLRDWQTNPLTTEDIRSTSLNNSPKFLAYLSACSTGPNSNVATPLMDENVHLISSFRLAGFRHVVGTLWEVQDEYCVDVARIFYETLRDEGISDNAVCLGLHRATMTLRNRVVTSVIKADSSIANANIENSHVSTSMPLGLQQLIRYRKQPSIPHRLPTKPPPTWLMSTTLPQFMISNVPLSGKVD
jgi:hypothetical protein